MDVLTDQAFIEARELARRARISYRRLDTMVGNRIVRGVPRRVVRSGCARHFTGHDVAVSAICARLGELGMLQVSQRVVAGIVYALPWPLEPGLLIVSSDLDWHLVIPLGDARGRLLLRAPGWVIELPPHLAP
jgi:hypothetical protein